MSDTPFLAVPAACLPHDGVPVENCGDCYVATAEASIEHLRRRVVVLEARLAIALSPREAKPAVYLCPDCGLPYDPKCVHCGTPDHTESRDCWCAPKVEVYEHGDVVIHNSKEEGN